MLDELGWQSIDGLQQKNAVVDLPPLVLREGLHKRLEVSAICAYLPFHRKGIKSFRIMQPCPGLSPCLDRESVLGLD